MSSELIGILLFLVQQFGVTLAVGASTFALMFYIVGASDGVIDASERRFMHAVYAVLRIGLILILISGICISGAHYFAGERAVLTSPVYLFKWLLLLIIIMNAVLMDMRILSAQSGGAVAGASWYALFVVHTLSLQFSWMWLLSAYAVWLVLFFGIFTLLRVRAARMYNEEGTLRVPVPQMQHRAENNQTTH